MPVENQQKIEAIPRILIDFENLKLQINPGNFSRMEKVAGVSSTKLTISAGFAIGVVSLK